MKLNDSPKVAELKSKYHASLSSKAQELNKYQSRIESADSKADLKLVFSEFEQYVHKLAGSSGMYGYDSISKVSRQLLMVLREDPNLQLRALLTKELLEELDRISQ
jgi:HPt (histidine-containing phosphotransfer) domain-containing protein